MPRPDGRAPDQQRPVTIELGFQRYPEGSALIKVGETWVLCAASVEDGVPPFITAANRGWMTAEYAMLPRATHTRSGRSPGGRGKEIQRLIGRALRGAFDLGALGARTITIDCDVLQADGGTRCASITGAWLAAALAARELERSGAIKSAEAFTGEPIAAISVGIIDGEARLDLPYEEDSRAEVDMNVVMSESGKLLEVQGTAERAAFSRQQLDELLDLAQSGIAELCAIQRRALEGS
jgi:ribonuclease PH